MLFRSNQAGYLARCIVANHRAAVAADIMMAARRAVFVPDNNDRIRADLDRDEFPGFREFARMRREEPALAPHGVQVGLVNRGIRKEFTGKRPTWLATFNQRFHGERGNQLGDVIKHRQRISGESRSTTAAAFHSRRAD